MSDKSRKVAIITGASSGIGMATALQFAEKGYDVVLAARRLHELHSVASQCEKHDVRALPVAIDTTDDEAMHHLSSTAVDVFGQIDVWVNNAGVYLTGKFEDLPLKEMRRMMDVNFFGYIHGSYTALMQFREQGYGTLINISSVNAAAPQPYVSVYSASKAAVRALDESLRMELRLEGLEKDIHVCTVMPASFDTNLFQNGANYTGKQVQAIEPVYDPTYAAKHIVKLAKTPRREIIIGPAGKMMAMQNKFTPGMYEKQVGKFTDINLLGDEAEAETVGNLYESIGDNRGMYGGWREKRLRADHFNLMMGAGLVAVAGLAGLGLFMLKRNQKS